MEHLAPTRFDEVYSLPVAADSILYRGRLLAVNAGGRGVAAGDTAGLVTVGRIEKTVDNRGGMHGDQLVPFRLGVFCYRQSVIDPITQALYGKPVFLEDDITIRATPGANNIFAGNFRGFAEDGGVWVDTRTLPMIASWFGNNIANNWRLSVDSTTGGTIMQLWNQDAAEYQTIQLAGAAGAEHFVIA